MTLFKMRLKTKNHEFKCLIVRIAVAIRAGLSSAH